MSELQRDVARVLRALGVPHQLEALTPDGLFSVDIALPGAARGPRGHLRPSTRGHKWVARIHEEISPHV